MKKAKKITMIKEYESVKLESWVVDMVRGNKEKTGIPVSTFIQRAILKELKQKASH